MLYARVVWDSASRKSLAAFLGWCYFCLGTYEFRLIALLPAKDSVRLPRGATVSTTHPYRPAAFLCCSHSPVNTDTCAVILRCPGESCGAAPSSLLTVCSSGPPPGSCWSYAVSRESFQGGCAQLPGPSAPTPLGKHYTSLGSTGHRRGRRLFPIATQGYGPLEQIGCSFCVKDGVPWLKTSQLARTAELLGSEDNI